MCVQKKSQNSTLEIYLHHGFLAEDLSRSVYAIRPAVRHSGFFCMRQSCSFSTGSLQFLLKRTAKTTPIRLLWSDPHVRAGLRVPRSLVTTSYTMHART